MKYLLRVLLFILMANTLFAIPRFAIMEEVSCSSCHSYQGGGGSRSTYGKDYVSESLVLRDVQLPWFNEREEPSVYFGVDTRYQMIAEDQEDLKQFPMQFAIYGSAELGNLISHFELNRILDEFRLSGGLRYEGLPLDSWVFLGRELPTLGWKIDDHTVFTRGGNITTLGLAQEGMPFTPYIEAPNLLELGIAPLGGVEVAVSAGTAFITTNMNTDAGNFSMAKLSYSFSTDKVVGQTGLSFLREGDLSATVGKLGIGMGQIVYLHELSQFKGWPSIDISSFAAMNQLSYRLLQGLDIYARYEFFDPDKNLSNGAINRSSLGVDFFPVPNVEVKLSYRRSELELPDSEPNPSGQVLGQIHLYL